LEDSPALQTLAAELKIPSHVSLAAPGGGAAFFCSLAERNSFTRVAEPEVTTSPPEYKPPPRRAYTDLGWLCAALSGPATFLAVWIYCAVTYGFLLGFLLGWIPALILALLVAVLTIFLWPLLAVPVLYVIYRGFGIHPGLLNIAVFIGIVAIATVWWWHMVRHGNLP
jgi:hypothetical protein